ncbi:Putative uncharacterized protein [Taphrina deformans PYCC 5710]|uniref:DUF323 domain protein n=1 Tax=Taphrina deformans (strain PYCC 5710 / ATCC 11124 / CBS 356.35 / IMI 108563 / JCM 9778 / NBRC 8474) TaxID=1097556 RepID=R4XD06_TAPDE|nr:Putative uncharacterized protein [Taphrina deformans PYCC 5710]|eukprot:CCG81205.1 Putative uncharacterized protein [Taphrina deformans PYCC 5710]
MDPKELPDIQTISKASPIEPSTIITSLRDGTLPTMLLYDEKGLQLFEKITYNPHYYLTESEIEILQQNSVEIASQIRDSTIIELGSGALRKTSLILQAVDALKIDTDYYALDLDRKELERCLGDLQKSFAFKHVQLHGLHADYNDIHAFIRNSNRRVSILWMGSSVGNFDRHEASDFLLSLKSAMKPGDSIVVGVDHRNAQSLVQCAYNDPEGDSQAFELNALVHANRILGREAFKAEEWSYEGLYDEINGRHEAAFCAQADVVIEEGLTIQKGSKIRIERSYKYSKHEVLQLFDRAQLNLHEYWSDERDLYSLYLTTVPTAYFSSNPRDIGPVPTLEEWSELWKLWDVITMEMVPREMLESKPIDLRNPCIFYVGHIPTFLDIHLSRVGNGRYLNPAYTQIFERGIDPDVDDPSQCHDHSSLPDKWPDLSEMLSFRDQVRKRLRDVYASGSINDRKVARAVFTVYEHEAMHIETFLYMHLQADWTLSPPKMLPPRFEEKPKEVGPASWMKMSPTTMNVGMNDVEGSDEGDYFGWDNEKPRRSTGLQPFTIQSRPVTNGEYAKYLNQTTEEGKRWRHPKSWTPDMRVKTPFGPIPLAAAVNWPVAASYDELEKYANWCGGRLPTHDELRHFIDSSCDTDDARGTPFNDVHGKKVNFSQWFPGNVEDSSKPQVYCGVWEWTSTPFARTPGFVTSQIYPGYSEDFFDGKHNIVLGGSWATISRIAARKSFVNWYQRNYEYAWTGCRLVKDV